METVPGTVDISSLRRRFADRFGRQPTCIVRAPGRVNLIGEHTDYNNGFVLPMATDMATYVLAAPRNDQQLSAWSAALRQRGEACLAGPGPPGKPAWFNYIKGVAVMLQRAGVGLSGCDLFIAGNLPIGGGLSSSAALEVGVARAMVRLARGGEELDQAILALLCRDAEHQYAGMPCGIMDQFVVTLARNGHALLLDCRSRKVEHVPLDLRQATILIADSGVMHELAGTAYEQRVRECRQGVAACGAEVGSLRDVTMDRLADRRDEGKISQTLFRRCRHVVTENLRTQQAANALRHGDLPEFGELMNASHASLRDDYQVTCGEVDALVELAQGCEGVLGARMTGGGFGGCVLALVRSDALDSVKTAMAEGYRRRCRRDCTFYLSSAAGGCAVVE